MIPGSRLSDRHRTAQKRTVHGTVLFCVCTPEITAGETNCIQELI